jgi:methyl-accepting chemotaxis protein
MDELRALITNISNEVRPLSASAQETLRETRTLVRNADQTVQNVGRRIDPLASRAESTLDATQKLITDINVEMTPAISGVNKILEEARAAGQEQPGSGTGKLWRAFGLLLPVDPSFGRAQ